MCLSEALASRADHGQPPHPTPGRQPPPPPGPPPPVGPPGIWPPPPPGPPPPVGPPGAPGSPGGTPGSGSIGVVSVVVVVVSVVVVLVGASSWVPLQPAATSAAVLPRTAIAILPCAFIRIRLPSALSCLAVPGTLSAETRAG
ncbi:hypothetical protein DQP56_23780 [Mycolicibacter senuensis]|nr:hypothetical protein DQP56_23780 [Mycolicibacter senuensis]